MALRFEWLGLSEASVEDGRGVTALVGLNQNVVVAFELPAVTRRSVVVILVDEGEPTLEPGSDLTLEMSVEGPDERRLMSATQTIQVGERTWPDIPGGINIAAQVQMSLTKYGTYQIRCVVTPEGDREGVHASKELYVVKPVGS